MKKTALLILISASFLLGGCGFGLSTEEKNKYNIMKVASEELKYSIDFDKYETFVLWMLSTDAIKQDSIVKAREIYRDIAATSVFDKLQSEAPTSTTSVSNNKMNNSADAAMGQGSIPKENGESSAEDLYPIYDNHCNIIAQGTKEESDKSLANWEATADNTILGHSVYKDLIVIDMDSKYTGEYKLRLTLVNDKIIDYNILR